MDDSSPSEGASEPTDRRCDDPQAIGTPRDLYRIRRRHRPVDFRTALLDGQGIQLNRGDYALIGHILPGFWHYIIELTKGQIFRRFPGYRRDTMTHLKPIPPLEMLRRPLKSAAYNPKSKRRVVRLYGTKLPLDAAVLAAHQPETLANIPFDDLGSLVVVHRDGDAGNVHYANLEWSTSGGGAKVPIDALGVLWHGARYMVQYKIVKYQQEVANANEAEREDLGRTERDSGDQLESVVTGGDDDPF